MTVGKNNLWSGKITGLQVCFLCLLALCLAYRGSSMVWHISYSVVSPPNSAHLGSTLVCLLSQRTVYLLLWQSFIVLLICYFLSLSSLLNVSVSGPPPQLFGPFSVLYLYLSAMPFVCWFTLLLKTRALVCFCHDCTPCSQVHCGLRTSLLK